MAKDLLGRLESVLQGGDPEPLLAPEAARIAGELGKVVDDGDATLLTVDTRVRLLSLLVHVHWQRYLLLPDGQGLEDLAACDRWGAILVSQAPDLVPEALRARLTGSDSDHAAVLRAEVKSGVAHLRNIHLADGSASSDEDRAQAAASSGVLLLNTYLRRGIVDSLEAAVNAFQDALAFTPPEHPMRPLYLSNLGDALWNHFRRTRRPGDLDEAIAVIRDAVQTIPPEHPRRGDCLFKLSVTLSARFHQTGQQAAVDEAVAVARQALQVTPHGDQYRPACQSNLGGVLLDRFQRFGQRADLDEAITLYQDALDTAPPEHPSRPSYQANLALALHIRTNSAS